MCTTKGGKVVKHRRFICDVETVKRRTMRLPDSATGQDAGMLFEPSQVARRYFELSAEQARMAFQKRLWPNEFIQLVRGPVPQVTFRQGAFHSLTPRISPFPGDPCDQPGWRRLHAETFKDP